MAWTEEPAQPVLTQAAFDPRLQLGRWRTPEMCADTDKDQVFRLRRSIFVLRVRGLLRAVRRRIQHPAVHLLDVIEHFGGTMQHPNGLSSPLDAYHHPRFGLGDIDFDGCARSAC